MWAFPPRRIVIGVDFGDASASAVRIAALLAGAFNAALHAVHAESIETPAYFLAEQIRTIEKQRRAARASATAYLERFVRGLTDVPVEARISEGPAADAILVGARDADLVVMGTHGRRGPSRWWAGSVAERVARAADLPVLVVRAVIPTHPFARIAVMTGSGASDHAAQRYATSLSAAFQGEPPHHLGPSAADAGVEDATLVVVPQLTTAAVLGISGAVESLLRSSPRPTLFVPSV